MARAWVDGDVAAVCGDHGSVPMEMWRWHLAEEFEHRAVVHRVLHRLYGAGKAFALRKSGADFNRAHLAGHSAQAAAYLHGSTGAGSTSRRSRPRCSASRAWLAIGTCFGAALGWVYEPDYDPATISPPRDYEATLAAYTPAVA
jgi:predicted metal-dependent hydrolase